MTKKILLLGGGYTLKRLAKELPASDFVITTRSSDKALALCQKGYKAEILDLGNMSLLEDFFAKHQDFDTIIDSVPPNFSSRSDHDIEKALLGHKNLMKVLSQYQLRRYFYLSTTGTFGVSDASWVNEETKCQPKSPRGQARLETEKLLAQGKTYVFTAFSATSNLWAWKRYRNGTKGRALPTNWNW